jgi:hypothetical protein
MYFMEAGYKTFNFRTSRIICSNGEFHSYMASVEVVRDAIDPLGWHQTMDEVVLGYAKALAAGGEFTRLLAPKIHPGDEKDRIVFDEQCEAWQKTGSIIDADAYWSSARKAVRLRLQDHDFRAKVIQECRFVYSKLFPWVNGVG